MYPHFGRTRVCFLESAGSGQGPLRGNGPSSSIKREEFHGYPSDCRVFKTACVPWTKSIRAKEIIGSPEFDHYQRVINMLGSVCWFSYSTVQVLLQHPLPHTSCMLCTSEAKIRLLFHITDQNRSLL
jgi:hypothetical protein